MALSHFDSGSISYQCIWDQWWTKWYWNAFPTRTAAFHLFSWSLHTHTYLSTTLCTLQQLTLSSKRHWNIFGRIKQNSRKIWESNVARWFKICPVSWKLRVSDPYSSPNIVRVIKSWRMRWAGHVARVGEKRDIYRVLVGKPEGKRQLGRPRPRWEDNIKMDLQEVGWGTWTELIWLRIEQVVGFCESGNEPSSSMKCGEFLD